MKTYQFIIFIIILIIFLLIFGFGFLSIYLTYAENRYCPPCNNTTTKKNIEPFKEKTKKEKKKEGKKEERIEKEDKVEEEIIENFEGLSNDIIDKSIFENTIPSTHKEEVKDVTKSWTGVELKYGEPLPEDDKKMDELEKIYVNPFFPGSKEKGTADGKEAKRNYPDPRDMVIVERDAYKYGYPDGMSMQDYVDWIYLFRKTPNLLNLEHYINYEKLIAGVPIYYRKGKTPPPSKKLTPLNAEDYFIQMYTKNPTKPIPQLTKMINEDVRVASNQGTSGILPANYIDYGDFKQNFGVLGSTGHIYNPELADKTDPNYLQYFVGPNWLLKHKSQKVETRG